MKFEEAIEEAEKAGLGKLFACQYFHQQVLECRQSKLVNWSFECITIELTFDVSEEDSKKIQEIFKKVEPQFESEIKVKVQRRKLFAGSKLPNFGHIKKVLQEGTCQLCAKQGQVLVIDVWATWCGPCQIPMKHNQQIIEKNNWGDQVRIVGVSVDSSVDDVKQRVKSRKWDKVQHLCLEGRDYQHILMKSLGVKGIPFICVVSKFGTIQYLGHPMRINLEKKIKELLNESGANLREKLNPNLITRAQYSQILQTIGSSTFFKQNFMKTFLSSKILSKINFCDGKTTYSAAVQVYVNEDEKELMQQYQKFIPSKNIQLQRNFVEIQNIPEVSESCSQCKKQIGYPSYWCRWSEHPTDFRCLQCVEKKESQTVYSYKSNSILLLGEFKRINRKAFGNNYQPDTSYKVQDLYPHQFRCFGCENCPKNVGEARYICLGCRAEQNHRGDYVDLCESSLKRYIAKDESIMQMLPYEHTPNHPFIRVLYNVKGYDNY